MLWPPHTPPSRQGSWASQREGLLWGNSDSFACAPYSLGWCCALVSKSRLGNLMGKGRLERLVLHRKGGKVGKRLHSQRVLGQRVTERSPRNRMWVIRERQAGFIGSCPRDQDGTNRLHFRKLLSWLQKQGIYFPGCEWETHSPGCYWQPSWTRKTSCPEVKCDKKRRTEQKNQQKNELWTVAKWYTNSTCIWTSCWCEPADALPS